MRNAIARLGLVILAAAFPFPGSAQPKPFAIRSISFPLIGTNYLDDISGWTPIPTVIQQLKALGANDAKVTISAGAYDSPLDNLPDPSVSYNPSEDKVLTFLKQLKAAGFGVTLQPFVNVNFDPSSNCWIPCTLNPGISTPGCRLTAR